MTEKNKIPAIRFKGFSEKWKVGELSSIYNKIRNAFVGTASPYYVKDGNFYLESNNVKDGQINRKTEIFINDEFYEKQKNNWLHTGDIVMVQSGHVGHSAVIPPSLNNTAAHALIIFSDPKEKVNPYFFNYQFQTNPIINGINQITTGNTIKHILSSEMKRFIVSIPKFEEQEIIGNFLTHFDHLITINQHKYNKLVTIKKAMLEKMFPQNGAIVPEIRFKGFTEAWEERKLGDIGYTYTGLSGKTKDDFGHGEGKFVTYMNVFSNSITQINLTEPIEVDGKQNEVKNGDVFFTTSSETPEEVGMSSVWLGNSNNTYLNSFCFGYRPVEKINNYYLAYMLRSSIFRKRITFLAQGISRYNISKSKTMEIAVPIPNINEQEKIGSYFTHLDNLITLHQCELEKLKNIKKACLEKMFV